MSGGALDLANQLERLPVTAIRKHHETVLMTLREAAQTLRQQHTAIRNLKVPRKSRAKRRQTTPQEAAQAIFEAMEGPIDVYQFKTGTHAVREPGTAAPYGAEWLGRYDLGGDWRELAESIAMTDRGA